MSRMISLSAAMCAGFAMVAQSQQVVTPPSVVAGPGLVATLSSTQAPATPPKALMLPDTSQDTTAPDLTRYLNNPDLLKFCTAQVAMFTHQNADIIFIGDSITQNWRGPGKNVWDANFAPRNALDFGIGGDKTQHVLWRLDNYPIQHLRPKVAVLLIGTNNTRNTSTEIAAGVKAVLTKTQTIFPGVKVILVSIMPNLRANALMMAADEILKTFADNQSIYYLDLVPLMKPVGDNWTGLSGDHLHPDAAGYQLWTDAMMPLLNKLLPPPAAAPQP